jgi:thiol-disulfide isomerase/thioredoxin
MNKTLKIVLVVALAAVLVAGLAATVGCDTNSGDNGNTNGEVNGNPSGNGDEPSGNGDEPNGSASGEPDITSGPGLITDCEEYTGSGFQSADPVPVFTFDDATGRSYSLSDYQGKYVILNFWRIGCGYCKLEMPYLEQIAADWADEDVALITIDIGDSAESVNEYLAENEFNLPVVLDRELLVTAQYRASSVPLTIFLDKEGLIRHAQLGAYQSVAEIEEILELLIALE